MSEITVQCGPRAVTLNNGLFINGEFVPSESKKTFARFNPANGEKICDVYEAEEADIDKAVTAATAAFESWGKHATRGRSEWMFKIVAGLEARAADFAHLESLDNGKTVKDSSAVDIPLTIQTFKLYAGLAETWLSGKTIDTEFQNFDFTRREPVGVCGAIIPWNFPLLMLAWKIAPALACGNTIVLKSSEKTPLTALLFARVLSEIDFPKGVVNIVSGFGPGAGTPIAKHMGIHKIAFTGSVPTAKRIMALAAESNLKKVTLELGGKSPNIIFDDADLEAATTWAQVGIFFNHGQVCCAGSRIYVQEGIYDRFVEKFVEKSKAIKLGDQFAADTNQGPQVDEVQFNRILGYLDAGAKQGAKTACGGVRVGDKGYYIAPTLLTDVCDDATVVKEEIFGPVACALKFKTEEEVIARANNSEYGLAAAVFTKDISRAFRVEKQLKAGTVWINCYNTFDVRLPFGGYKQSGFGRELSEYAIEAYTQIKTVRVNLA